MAKRKPKKMKKELWTTRQLAARTRELADDAAEHLFPLKLPGFKPMKPLRQKQFYFCIEARETEPNRWEVAWNTQVR